MPDKINLYCVWITCNLLDMACSSFGTFYLFLQAVTPCLLGTCLNQHSHHWLFWIHILHLTGKTRKCLCATFWLFLRVFSQIDLCLHHIVPFIHTLVALSKACEKVKVGLHFIWLGLAEFIKLSPDLSKVNSSDGRLHETYWSSNQCKLLDFLAFLLFRQSCNFTF